MTFHAFLQTKYPLYSDTEIKVNLTVSQLLELVEEFISETSPVFEVKVVDKETIFCHECKKRHATKDYNGTNYMVCDTCFNKLSDEFDEEYD